MPRNIEWLSQSRTRSRTAFVRSFAAASLAVVLGCGPARAADTAAMTAGGQFNVAPNGAFTYGLPIASPPGTAGVVPALSLNYSNQAGDDYEGLGWVLSGLSKITRCPRTQTVDSAHGGVNFDANDRFCLDGRELVVTGGGQYGANGTEYRTFSDIVAKIVSYGTTGSGPSYFVVQTKSGRTLEYGNTPDSKFQPLKADASGVAPSVSVWALDKASDNSGNYMTVTYVNDTSIGQIYPSRVDYTGNGSLAPYNSVRFTYMDRGFPVPAYQAGTVTKISKLLTHVQTFAGSAMVRDYRLAYNYASSGADHDELKSFTPCDGATTCLAATAFTWQGSDDRLTLTSTPNALASGLSLFAGDFNGDGLTDAVAVDTSCPAGGVVWSGSNAGSFARAGMTASYVYYLTDNTTPQNYSGPACLLDSTALPGDFNGDGFSDVILNETYWSYIDGSWDPSNFANVLANSKTGNLGETTVNHMLPSLMILGDFDGDGRTDGFAQTSTAYGTPYISNGDGTFKAGATIAGLGVTSSLIAGDFDGDGCTDLLAQGSTNAISYFCSPAIASAIVPAFSGAIVTGDFNGDGKTDVVVVGTTAATLYLSTGTGFTSGTAIPGSANWHTFQVTGGDFNGDGKTDLVLISHTAGTPHQFYLSTGTGFTPALDPSGNPVTIANSDSAVGAVVTDWNSDGADDVWLKKASGDSEATFSYTPQMITQAANGVGASVTVHYDRVNRNGTFYAKGNTTAYPLRDMDGAYYVVSETDTSNGIGGTCAHTYTYAGAIADSTVPATPLARGDLAATGFLAFAQVAMTDVSTGLVQTTTIHTDVPFVGLVASRTLALGALVLSSESYTYSSNSGDGGNLVTITNTTTARTDLDGTAWPTLLTVNIADAYGNTTRHTVFWADGSFRETNNTYNNDVPDWIIGQLLTTTVESGVNTSSLTRHYSFGYDPVTTKVNQAAVEPGNTALEMDVNLTYDAFGNRNSTKLSGSGAASRTSSVTYDAAGEFPASTTNALNQSDSWTYDPVYGGPASHSDLNGLVQTWSYDTMGRLKLTVRPDGNQTVYSYAYCAGVNGGSASCPSLGATQQTVTPENASGVQNGAATIVTFDELGREIARDVQGFDGSWIRKARQYDSNYHLAKESRPYFLGGGDSFFVYWTSYAYDVLGRVTSATAPDSSVTTYAYHALTTTVTDSLNHTASVTRNDHGLIASVIDANGKTSTLGYDFFDNPNSASDPASNATTATYDIRGRKTAMSDPDLGSWSYGYDVFSELTSQTDAKSQTTTVNYDVLGRPTKRIATDQTSIWTYDGGPDGMGLLTHACAAATCAAASDEHTPSYSPTGNVNGLTYRIDGTNYIYNANYNSDGRLSALTYPSGFRADYDYNSYGYLVDIKDHSTHAAIWTANAADAELRVTQSTAGNGVITNTGFDQQTGRLLNVCATSDSGLCDGNVANMSYSWDTDGNLTQRSDTVEGTSESFCYDALNRVTQASFGASCTTNPHKLFAYAVSGNGNITRKSDVCNTAGCMTYGAGAGPHALTGITGVVEGIVNPTFAYDADGNMTSGLGRAVNWTTFNMVSSITQGTTQIGLLYGPDHERYKQCVGGCTSPTSSLLYLNDPVTGGGSEKSIAGSTVKWNDYIVADGRIVAEHFNNMGVISTRYFTGDHLGSTAVLTDETGTVAERDSYDTWGKRRHANGNDDPTCSQTSQTTRGYTGQEHLDSVCLINMNARIYDPTIGRFMSADTIVPDRANGQSYNRYSYTNNNPLNATDPSGHALEEDEPDEYSLVVLIGGGDDIGDGDGGDDSGGMDGGGDDGGIGGGDGGELDGGGLDGLDDASNTAMENVVVWGCRSCLNLSGALGPLYSGNAPGFEPAPHDNNRDDTPERSYCDSNVVNALNKTYEASKAIQAAGGVGELVAGLTALAPGGQEAAASLAQASMAFDLAGTIGQLVTGGAIWAETGDSTQLKISVNTAGMAGFIEFSTAVKNYTAGGVVGDLMGNHEAHCPG